MHQITLIRSGALGDTVLMLPTLYLLKRHYPGSIITFVGSHWALKLIPLLNIPCRLVSYDSMELAPLFAASAPTSAPDYIREADLIVAYVANTDGEFAMNLRQVTRGRVIIWDSNPPADRHAAEHFASALAQINIDTKNLPAPGLTPGDADRRSVQGWLRHHINGNFAVVHPGSGSPHKCWPAEKFARLVTLITSHNKEIVMLQGPADKKACEKVLVQLPDTAPVTVAGWEDLGKVTALLQQGDFYVGNDSGMSHLAGAAGIKGCAIFGPTDHKMWRPYGTAITPVYTMKKQYIWPDVEEVWTRLQRIAKT